jgi:hypothetical protein
MSIRVCVHHEGWIAFHEEEAIDYALLARHAGYRACDLLQDLIASPVRIPDVDLVRRCQNSCTSLPETVTAGGTTTPGFAGGGRKAFGLSDVVSLRKNDTRLKEKHLPPIRELMLQLVVDCGFTPDHIVVLDAFDGDNDLTGSPNLVPEYQFWKLYIKVQHPGKDFSKIQQLYRLKHNEKQQRLAAQSAGAGGLIKLGTAPKKAKLCLAAAEEMRQQRLVLQAELGIAAEDGTENTVESTHHHEEVPIRPVPSFPQVVTPPPQIESHLVPPEFPPVHIPTSNISNISNNISSSQSVSTISTDGVHARPYPTESIKVEPLPGPRDNNSAAESLYGTYGTSSTITSTATERKQRKDLLATYTTTFKEFQKRINSLLRTLRNFQKASIEHRIACHEVSFLLGVFSLTKYTF